MIWYIPPARFRQRMARRRHRRWRLACQTQTPPPLPIKVWIMVYLCMSGLNVILSAVSFSSSTGRRCDIGGKLVGHVSLRVSSYIAGWASVYCNWIAVYGCVRFSFISDCALDLCCLFNLDIDQIDSLFCCFVCDIA